MWSIRPDDLWAGVEGGIAVVGATYLAQSPAIRRAVKDLFLERCSQATSATGELEFPTEAAYVLAKKPCGTKAGSPHISG